MKRKRWEHNQDYLVWTFYVRPDARWPNGDPLTASDFAFSIQRILTPELGAFFADELYILHGAEDFHKGIQTCRLGILSNSLIFSPEFRCTDADLFVAPSCSSFL